MEISNRAFRCARSAALGPNVYPLRLSIVEAGPHEATVEATTLRFDDQHHHARSFRDIEIANPRKRSPQASPFVAVQVIPTGVTCAFGGFAGDAGPVTNLLASAADFLVTHAITAAKRRPTTAAAGDVAEAWRRFARPNGDLIARQR
jgi:hypothetical protein